MLPNFPQVLTSKRPMLQRRPQPYSYAQRHPLSLNADDKPSYAALVGRLSTIARGAGSLDAAIWFLSSFAFAFGR